MILAINLSKVIILSIIGNISSASGLWTITSSDWYNLSSVFISDGFNLYSKQNKCIQEIKNERKLLNEDINTIKKALTTLAKIELDKQCTDALNCGYISQTRLRWLEDVYAIYAPFGENGEVDTTINRVRQLPFKNQQSQWKQCL